MQKIVLFIEPNDYGWDTSAKLGSLFMNRFAIEEDEKSEILKIFQLECALFDFKFPTKRSVESKIGEGFIMIF